MFKIDITINNIKLLYLLAVLNLHIFVSAYNKKVIHSSKNLSHSNIATTTNYFNKELKIKNSYGISLTQTLQTQTILRRRQFKTNKVKQLKITESFMRLLVVVEIMSRREKL